MRRWFHYVSIMFLFVNLGLVVTVSTPILIVLLAMKVLFTGAADACEKVVETLMAVFGDGRRALQGHFKELFEEASQ